MAGLTHSTRDTPHAHAAPAIVVLGPSALASARRIQQALPGAVLHLLRKRFDALSAADTGADVAVFIDDLGAHLRRCYTAGTPLIALCAAGIVIRCLAPVIGASAKTDEPAVLAVAEDGSAVVPLLGGLSGANDLARRAADLFACKPAITTSGELRFGRCLLSPPVGYALADIDAGKRFVSDVLAGAPVQVDGSAPWLDDLALPQTGPTSTETASSSVTPQALHTIRIGIERTAPEGTLLIHPRSVIVHVGRVDDRLVARIDTLLESRNIARAALAGLCCPLHLMGDDRLEEAADALGVPVRYTDSASRSASTDSTAATTVSDAVHAPPTDDIALDVHATPVDVSTTGIARGMVSVVGLGPGDKSLLAPMAAEALRQASDILGYTTYVDMAGPFAAWQTLHGTDNREEMARARHALRLAAEGRRVAIVSSGDPGVFAMAAAVMEALDVVSQTDRVANPDTDKQDAHDGQGPPLSQAQMARVRVQIIPGITAAFATAAAAGAPLGHDCCLISLSDNLKPWEIIETRLRLAAEADMAIALYNPISRARPWQLDRALALLRTIRRPETPVVLGRDVGRPGGRIRHHTLASLQASDVDMRTMVIIGASTTRRILLGAAVVDASNTETDETTLSSSQSERAGAVRQWVYTPRSYPAAGQDH